MDLFSGPFDRAPIPVHWDRGINHTKIKGSCQEMIKENFIPRKEEVNWNQNSYVTPTFSISPKAKTPDLLNLSDYQKVYPFVQTLFKETRETFPLAARLKYFLKKMGKRYKRFNNPKHSQSLFYRLCGDSLPTKNTNKSKIKPSSGRTCITGVERNAGEGGHKGGNSL